MGNDYHQGPWFIDKKPTKGSGFNVRPVDPKNPASFRTYNDEDGEFARRIVRALEQVDAAPELLEALKWAVKQGNLGYAARTKGNTAYCDAVDRAAAVIAKAEDNEQRPGLARIPSRLVHADHGGAHVGAGREPVTRTKGRRWIMSEHTPGPWNIGLEGEIAYTIEDATGQPVCGVYLTPGMGFTLTREQGEANAHIVAAATELLEALRVLVEHARETHPHFESDRGQRDMAQSFAAIAKAEGNES